MENKEKAGLARRLCDSGDFREALRFFKELQCDSNDTATAAGYLLDEATCYAKTGDSKEAQKCIDRARVLVNEDPLAQAQIDFFAATLLIEEGEREEGVRVLSRILRRASLWSRSMEGRELYEKIQIQRGFTLMHLSRCAEARVILEESLSFESEDDVKSSIHCHLGRCFHETGMYSLAKHHFLSAQNLTIPQDWEGVFHYYYGYTLFELKEFDSARREFILSLQSGSSDPPESLRYAMLAATHRELGDLDEARRYERLARQSRSAP